MNEKNALKKLTFTAIVLVFVLSLGVKDGFSALVNEDEAIAVADIWYAMELNSGYAKMDETERVGRLGKLENHEVLYLVSKDDLRDSPPDKGEVLAYVVKYDPTGFVVIAGEDRIEPVVVFSVKSGFRWDQPKLNFLRYFLGKTMPEYWECLRAKEAEGVKVDVHPNWSYLRSELLQVKALNEVSYEAPEQAIFVLLNTATWSQGDPYNERVVANNGNTAGIPTGCVATAMAIKMRFHEWPPTGSGSHSYTDNDGDVQYSHSVNFGAQSYNWSAMPTGSLTSANAHVANMMYYCGVAVDMDYEAVGGSGAYVSNVEPAMDTYFRYHGTVYRTSEHENRMIRSIKGELPVVIAGGGHACLCDGYRTTQSPYFHINAGWDGSCNGWYNLSGIPNDSSGCGTVAIEESCPYGSPDNYIYVDGVFRMFPTGSLGNAFYTISDGVSAVPSGGQLWIKAGTYTGAGNVPVTFDKAMTIRTYEGTAVIGDNLSLTASGRIGIYGSGELKIY